MLALVAYLWRAKHCGDAVEHLLEDPAAHPQDRPHSEQLLLHLALVTDLQGTKSISTPGSSGVKSLRVLVQ